MIAPPVQAEIQDALETSATSMRDAALGLVMDPDSLHDLRCLPLPADDRRRPRLARIRLAAASVLRGSETQDAYEAQYAGCRLG